MSTSNANNDDGWTDFFDHYDPPASLLNQAGCDPMSWNQSNQAVARNDAQVADGNGGLSSSHDNGFPGQDYNHAQNDSSYDTQAAVNDGTYYTCYDSENYLQPSSTNGYCPVMPANHNNGYPQFPPNQTMLPSGGTNNSCQEMSSNALQFVQPGQYEPSYQYFGTENNLQPSSINGYCSVPAHQNNGYPQLPPNETCGNGPWQTPMYVDTNAPGSTIGENSYPNSMLPTNEPSMLSSVGSMNSNQDVNCNSHQFTELHPIQRDAMPQSPPEPFYGATRGAVGINHGPTYFEGEQNPQNQREFSNDALVTVHNGTTYYQNDENNIYLVVPAEPGNWNEQPAPTQSVYSPTPVSTIDGSNSYQNSPLTSVEYQPSMTPSSDASSSTSPSQPKRNGPGRPTKTKDISQNVINVRRSRGQNKALDEEVKKHGAKIIYTALSQGAVLPENYMVAVTEMARLHGTRYQFPTNLRYSKFLFSTTGPGRKIDPNVKKTDAQLQKSKMRIQREAGVFLKLLKEVSRQLKKIDPAMHTKLLPDIQRNSPNLYAIISKQ